MAKFQYSSLINAPVEVVWKFHEKPDILQLLTPPWQPVQIIRRQGGLEVGAISEFRLWLGIFPVTWVSRHIECKTNQLFTDVQISGPMDSWVHEHQFSQENGKTKLTDVISYSLPGGLISEFFLSWWVNARLHDMFCYRHQVTKRECDLRIGLGFGSRD